MSFYDKYMLSVSTFEQNVVCAQTKSVVYWEISVDSFLNKDVQHKED